jgi:hypothetical protein
MKRGKLEVLGKICVIVKALRLERAMTRGRGEKRGLNGGIQGFVWCKKPKEDRRRLFLDWSLVRIDVACEEEPWLG